MNLCSQDFLVFQEKEHTHLTNALENISVLRDNIYVFIYTDFFKNIFY